MSNDETRGNESPDRQYAIDPNDPLETHLEAIDRLTRALLVKTTPPDAPALDELDATQRREVRRRLREIRAETSRIGLLLIGPEAAIPYRPEGVTTYSGPDPDRFEDDSRRTDTQEERDD
ncbi:hypothetical protein [Natrialba asiatica]|uniref:Uncharacterized protein n=1 Tax=Natrialba asiatica (strain ATCC 700177 / DSM 12278 / JCM 9576 / FERM P-10747 / NBRC 102637 / 172P1) TaxID=29540 RepID=M0AWM6_NATA1|nr:hypothetical protein [Natrialba asiatica]ELZ01814.1 hypothetical protein C481_09847 [Natrialba asiatica DSM 12278]